MSSSTNIIVKPEETKQRIDALAELRKAVARLEARTDVLRKDLVALHQFVSETHVLYAELMDRLCSQVFRISDMLPVVPNNNDNEDNDNREEEGGGLPENEAVYQENNIL